MSQVWLVTGSSRGLGRAIVEASLAAGNKVMATARNTESLNDLSDRYGNQVKLFALDVTDESAATTAVKTAIDTFGSRWASLSTTRDTAISRPVEDTPMSDFRAPNRNEPLRDDHCDKGSPSIFRGERKGGHFCSIFIDGRKDPDLRVADLLGCEMGR